MQARPSTPEVGRVGAGLAGWARVDAGVGAEVCVQAAVTPGQAVSGHSVFCSEGTLPGSSA